MEAGPLNHCTYLYYPANCHSNLCSLLERKVTQMDQVLRYISGGNTGCNYGFIITCRHAAANWLQNYVTFIGRQSSKNYCTIKIDRAIRDDYAKAFDNL